MSYPVIFWDHMGEVTQLADIQTSSLWRSRVRNSYFESINQVWLQNGWVQTNPAREPLINIVQCLFECLWSHVLCVNSITHVLCVFHLCSACTSSLASCFHSDGHDNVFVLVVCTPKLETRTSLKLNKYKGYMRSVWRGTQLIRLWDRLWGHEGG